MARGSRQGLSRASLITSMVVHVLAFAALLGLQGLQAETRVYETIQIRVVSAPPATSAVDEEPPPAPEEELVVETPEELEPAVEEEAPVVQEEIEPEPEETPAPPLEETPPPSEDPPAATQAESDEPREEGGDDLDVRLEGLRRDYPAYYGNIIVQMRRCFRPREEDLEASVRFVIHRDGSTSDFETVHTSGSFAFDVEAQGAVECAGKPGRIGPLPDDFPWATLPIEFTFSPRGG